MINEIKNLHNQIPKDQLIRVILNVENFEIAIAPEDVIKETNSGMLRIIRANGNITSVNPEHIAMICHIWRGYYE